RGQIPCPVNQNIRELVESRDYRCDHKSDLQYPERLVRGTGCGNSLDRSRFCARFHVPFSLFCFSLRGEGTKIGNKSNKSSIYFVYYPSYRQFRILCHDKRPSSITKPCREQ